jgi:hypothetical protein
MIFPRTRGTLLCFEDDIALAMPHVTRITSLPRSKTARPDPFAKPTLHNVVAVRQVLRAPAGVGARAGHASETLWYGLPTYRLEAATCATSTPDGGRLILRCFVLLRAGIGSLIDRAIRLPVRFRSIRHERHDDPAEGREKRRPAPSSAAYHARPTLSDAWRLNHAIHPALRWRSQRTTRPTVDPG